MDLKSHWYPSHYPLLPLARCGCLLHIQLMKSVWHLLFLRSLRTDSELLGHLQQVLILSLPPNSLRFWPTAISISASSRTISLLLALLLPIVHPTAFQHQHFALFHHDLRPLRYQSHHNPYEIIGEIPFVLMSSSVVLPHDFAWSIWITLSYCLGQYDLFLLTFLKVIK